MTTNLAHKYRPESFGEVIGQNMAVSQILKHLDTAMDNPNDPIQPIILSGQHGVGKTSLGRLIVKYLNCDNPTSDLCVCSTCDSISNGTFVDFLELDGAIHNGVDNVRDIQRLTHIRATYKYKVFLIDEVHQFSSYAFNALLKTLETPPPKVLFILATTEPDKIQNTIVSRSLCINLRDVSVEEIKGRLLYISCKEGIDIKNKKDILDLISNKANGSVRDGIKLLYSVKDVETIEEAKKILSSGSLDDYNKLINSILNKNSSDIITIFDQFKKDGIKASQLYNELCTFVLDIIYTKTKVNVVDFYEENYKQYSLVEINDLLGSLLKSRNLGVDYNSLIYHFIKYSHIEERLEEKKVKTKPQTKKPKIKTKGKNLMEVISELNNTSSGDLF